jgi:hypothetical protein
MVLMREEKERLVLDLYAQGKSTREIAPIAHVSFRDIGAIIDRKEKEKEAKEGQSRQGILSTQAYKLFSESKSPVQVAITLNIREPEVARFYVEYWKLRQLYSLNKIYEEIKDGIGYFVRLYRLARVARMGVEQVVKVLEIANNDLPLVEHKCERLKREIDEIEAEKYNSARLLQEISDQITTMRKTLDQHQLSCKEQRLELTKLQMQRVRLEGLVGSFQNDNEGYIKIRNTVEEKVVSILSDKKMLLKLALLSLTESMRKNPNKYSHLIYNNNTSSTPRTQATDYDTDYGQKQYPSQTADSNLDMLLEEAEKLYNKLAKELVDESINDYTSSTSSSLLPVLPPSEE